MQTISDNNLLEQLKTEDAASFNQLYKICFPAVAAYIKQNSGNAQNAEDIFQEAIIVLLQKIRQPDFVLTSSLKTFVFAVSKNLWLKYLRDNKLIIVNDNLDSFQFEKAGEFNPFPDSSREEKLQTWLEKITEKCRYILKAIFFYNEPMKSLMLKMGWKNRHTADNQKYKCLKQIKKLKEKENEF